MKQFEARIGVNRIISPSWKVLGIDWPEELSPPRPGQFFTFRPQAVEPGDSGLLRRPLAFAAFDGRMAYALYQIRGGATKALSLKDEGAGLSVIAALGNSFPMPGPGETAYLLGGGIGIGPMLFLFSTLLKERGSPGPGTELLLGFRSSSFVPDFSRALMGGEPGGFGEGRFVEDFPGLQSLADAVSLAALATDDGTGGFCGTVMEALEADSSRKGKTGGAPRHYYACGPSPMLSALRDFTEKESSPAHVSVEQWMACGVGACHGCVLPSSRGGYVRACADGPVFAIGDILWKK